MAGARGASSFVEVALVGVLFTEGAGRGARVGLGVAAARVGAAPRSVMATVGEHVRDNFREPGEVLAELLKLAALIVFGP
jgi:hypothetical protein